MQKTQLMSVGITVLLTVIVLMMTKNISIGLIIGIIVYAHMETSSKMKEISKKIDGLKEKNELK